MTSTDTCRAKELLFTLTRPYCLAAKSEPHTGDGGITATKEMQLNCNLKFPLNKTNTPVPEMSGTGYKNL